MRRDFSVQLSAQEAVRRLDENPVARWTGPWGKEPGPDVAWSRLKSPLFEPVVHPEFTILPDERIFAIGSCFARGVEGALRREGFAVESVTDTFDEFPIAAAGTRPMGFTNKYNPPSIANELRWALDENAAFPDTALIGIDEDHWIDPYANPVFERGSRDMTLDLRRRLTSLTRKVADCRVVVITLGLIEAWFDTQTSLYTNSTPPLVAPFRDRFEFRVLRFDEVMKAFADVHELLTRFGHPELEIVVTVSPVPLLATFTGQDVVMANTRSKALLRAAASEWSDCHRNVHYFPSYEMVVNSNRDLTWEQDGRHVRNEVVAHIMHYFMNAYTTWNERTDRQHAVAQTAIAPRQIEASSA
jgi:hypothetical protein